MSDKIINAQKNNNMLDIQEIYEDIRGRIYEARRRIYKHIDNSATEINWYVGKIASELLGDNKRADYGKQIIEALSKKLQAEFGSGFAPVSIRRMRRFYDYFPIWSAVPTELTWSHFQELIPITRKEERDFYMQECIKSNWGYRELRRQIGTKLYDRLLISQDENYVLDMSKEGLIVNKPEDILKAPYIFEFAGLKQDKSYLESDLQKALLSHLSEFLLELGRGFYYGGEKERLRIGDEYYYPDLVFYNRLAKCFVIIDLKMNKLTHGDIGQMQMYVNYFKQTKMLEWENEPIGILLCASKNDTMVEMTLGDNKNIYTASYLTYLPTKEELITVIEDEKERIESIKNLKDEAN
ncbi:MAG: PDDEXK nuclease domain-containing protein [Oscillospiraceae bacterium]|nr:PDDEXK nuclease domain-containing protein [Oscillospiraceae bacterium]